MPYPQRASRVETDTLDRYRVLWYNSSSTIPTNSIGLEDIMKLSTKTRYGVRSVLDLALNYGIEPVSLKEIAAHQQLPHKYLEHVLARLRAAGFVRSVRGPQGGYTLAKPPDQITIREVFDVLEGSEGFVHCTTDPQVCDRYDICVTREVWARMYAACMEVLESTTLEDLAQRARQKRDALAPMYYI